MTGGLIALTGGPSGPIDRALAAGSHDQAEQRLPTLAEPCSATGSMSRSSATASPRSGASRRRWSSSPIGLDLPLVAANEPFFAGHRRL